MYRFLLRRLVQACATVLGVITVAFFLVRLSGNPAVVLLGPEATQADIDALSASLGFDRPLVTQYLDFLAGAATGDLGLSLRQGLPALDLVLQRLPATAELALGSFALGLGLAVVTVLVIHISGNDRIRSIVLWFGSARQAIPSFWLGLMLVVVFSVILGVLPALGRNGPESIVLPMVTIASLEYALYVRILDSGFTEQHGQEYVRTAYAKGQSRTAIMVRHVFPNAVLPLITVAGLNLGALLGGTIVVELVYSWPGLGQLVMSSISSRDYTVVQASLFVVAVFFVLVNLLVDVLYVALDPRVRLR